MKTILVTGRNGFVGNALARRLKEEFKVVSVIRAQNEGIDYHGEDVVLSDAREITAAMLQERRIDLVVHCAARVRGNPRLIEEENVESSRAVFGLAKNLGAPVVYLSSTNALFSKRLGPYARSKKACEDLLIQTGLDFLIVRVPLVLGPGAVFVDKIGRFYGKFKFFPLFGPQEGRVQPISIGRLVDVLIDRIRAVKLNRQTQNYVGRQNYTYRKIIEEIICAQGKIRFLCFSKVLSMALIGAAQQIGLNGPISCEEIKSVNMDKIVIPSVHGPTISVENRIDELVLHT